MNEFSPEKPTINTVILQLFFTFSLEVLQSVGVKKKKDPFHEVVCPSSLCAICSEHERVDALEGVEGVEGRESRASRERGALGALGVLGASSASL